MKRAIIVLLSLAGIGGVATLAFAIVTTNDTTSCAHARLFCLPPTALLTFVLALATELILIIAAVVGIIDALRQRNWGGAGLLALLLAIAVGMAYYVVPGHPAPMLGLLGSDWSAPLRSALAIFGLALLPLTVSLYCWLSSPARRATQLAILGGLATFTILVILAAIPPTGA